MTTRKKAWQGVGAVFFTVAFFACCLAVGLAEDQPTSCSWARRALVILAVLAIASIALLTSDGGRRNGDESTS